MGDRHDNPLPEGGEFHPYPRDSSTMSHDSRPAVETNDESDFQLQPEQKPEPVTPTKISGDKGKAKEDSLKTPTKTGVLDQQATPINQRGTASQAVSDGFASLT